MENAFSIVNIYMKISTDKRVNVWHISIYMALVYLWYKNDLSDNFYITRKTIMHLAHVGSIATYHKCIKQLQDFGYIKYKPSFNPCLGTMIVLEETCNDKIEAVC